MPYEDLESTCDLTSPRHGHPVSSNVYDSCSICDVMKLYFRTKSTYLEVVIVPSQDL